MVVQSRMTQQRAVILEELRKVTSHPTADEIYTMVRKKMPKISLGTVYRNLELLSEKGEILKLEYAGFQMRFDGNAAPHTHLRCESCGRVADVMGVSPAAKVPEGLSVPGFRVSSARVEFFGLCDGCRGKIA